MIRLTAIKVSLLCVVLTTAAPAAMAQRPARAQRDSLRTARELFGDGDYEEGEVSLRPERSHNLNLYLTYDRTFASDHTVLIELGGTYRGIGDYIIAPLARRVRP